VQNKIKHQFKLPVITNVFQENMVFSSVRNFETIWWEIMILQ